MSNVIILAIYISWCAGSGFYVGMVTSGWAPITMLLILNGTLGWFVGELLGGQGHGL